MARRWHLLLQHYDPVTLLLEELERLNKATAPPERTSCSSIDAS